MIPSHRLRLRSRALCAALVCALGLAGSEAAAAAHRTPHLVTFDEPGLLHYAGGIAGIAATRPSSPGQRLDGANAPAHAYRGYLAQQRSVRIAQLEVELGRPLRPTHSYSVIRSGVALELTDEEAKRIADSPGVLAVKRADDVRLATYAGPAFIGAPALWAGTAVPGIPGIPGNRGQGQVIAVIDTGSFAAHPAFANDAGCGFNSASPKLLSTVDCASASDGVCTGTTPEANDGNGHGVHVAATAAGNTLDIFDTVPAPALPAPYTELSGVAPCAQLRSYKVCETNSCSLAAMEAALENAILDGVDVVNLSISGGTDPWNDYDRSLLDAVGQDIVVVAAAGNTSDFQPDPVGAVNHLGPWVTTVAAITHDQNTFGAGVLAVVGDTVPTPLRQLVATPSTSPDLGDGLPTSDIVHAADNPNACAPFAPGTFDGEFVLAIRGDCDFSQKVANLDAAGAGAAIIYNNTAGPLRMDVRDQTLPAYGLGDVDGDALRDYIETSAPAAVRVSLTPASRRGDVLAGFSLRGPGPAGIDVLKPNLAAPGVSIYAATDAVSGNYQRLDGTSMAAPHVAGAAALLRALHPDWSATEIHSALQTTAHRQGTREDGATAWDADDVGTGRAAIDRAAAAGLTLHEDYADFVAADPSAQGEPASLNVASMRDLRCDDRCTFVRTVRNRLARNGTWSAEYVAASGDIDVVLDPPQFTLSPGGSQDITLTFTPPPGVPMPAPATGTVLLRDLEGDAPEQALPVIVQGRGSENYLQAATAQLDAIDHCSANDSSNGIAEPGERIELHLPVTAHGDDFAAVEAVLLPPYPAGAQLLRGSDTLGNVALGTPADATFELQLARSAACLDALPLRGELRSAGRAYPFVLDLPVGRERPLPDDLPLAVPDGDASVGSRSTLIVTQAVPLDGLAVQVTVEHAWVGDLRIVLVSPAGTHVTLLDRPGYPARSFGCGNRDVSVRFADGGMVAESVCAAGGGAAWPVAEAAPVDALAQLAGESSIGTWTLHVTDATSGYGGRIMAWSLQPQPDFEPACAACIVPGIFTDGFDSAP